MKIDINKKYRTRDGREAIVHTATGPRVGFPVVATVYDKHAEGLWMSRDFTEDGRFYPPPMAECADDLIEVREPREFEISGEGRNWKCISGVGWTPGETIRVREIID
jgi:hypothetical protein